MLANGNFESGFRNVPGCGMVGQDWGCFTNGGTVDYGFYDDQWAPVVGDGKNSQLIEINTMQYAASEPNRYAGIYQTVNLVAGAPYTLKLSGGMREHNPDPKDDKFRYRVAVGLHGRWLHQLDHREQLGRAAVGQDRRANVTHRPAELQHDIHGAQRQDHHLRSGLEEVGHVVQGAGRQPGRHQPGRQGSGRDQAAGAVRPIVVCRRDGVIVVPPPVVATAVVVVTPAGVTCGGANLLANGNFESGFINGVGKSWASFTNGGAAAYGFYDEQWTPVIKDGTHGQLIEINTWGLAASDPRSLCRHLPDVGGLKNGRHLRALALGHDARRGGASG